MLHEYKTEEGDWLDLLEFIADVLKLSYEQELKMYHLKDYLERVGITMINQRVYVSADEGWDVIEAIRNMTLATESRSVLKFDKFLLNLPG